MGRNRRKERSRRSVAERPSSAEALAMMTRGEPVEVPLQNLVVDTALQPRIRLDSSKVEEYHVRYQEGSIPPPIDVYRDADGNLLVSDGYHRLRVYELEEVETIPAYIIEGDWIAARLNAERKNLAHGLSFTNEDKLKILHDRMVYGYGGFAVDEENNIVEKPSNRELAREFGVSHVSIGRWIDQIIDELTGTNVPVDVSSVKKAASVGADGKVRDTTKIGKSQAKKKSSTATKSAPKPVQMNIFDWLKKIEKEFHQHELEAANQQMASLNSDGKPVNEADRAYMNGYVDAIQKLRQIMEERKIELKID